MLELSLIDNTGASEAQTITIPTTGFSNIVVSSWYPNYGTFDPTHVTQVNLEARGNVWGNSLGVTTMLNLDVAYMTVGLAAATWVRNDLGAWTTATNWNTNLIPNGVDAVATFGNMLTSNHTVSIDGDTTLGTLTFYDAAASYYVSGAGSLILQTAAGTGGTINVISGNHALTPDKIEIASSTLLTVTSGSLTLGGTKAGLVIDAGKTLSIAHGSTVNILGVIHNQGTLSVLASDGLAQASVLAVGGMDGSGTLDLTNNKLILHDADVSGVEAQLGGGAITSSLAAASGGTTALGVLSGAAHLALCGNNATFGGQRVLAGDILAGYTSAGDTTLKGYIDATDFAQIDAAWLRIQNGALNAGFHWANGDFNHDGRVDATDFALIDAAYALQGGHLAAEILDQVRFAGTAFESVYQAALSSALSGAVPESASLGLLALGALGLLRRRR